MERALPSHQRLFVLLYNQIAVAAVSRGDMALGAEGRQSLPCFEIVINSAVWCWREFPDIHFLTWSNLASERLVQGHWSQQLNTFYFVCVRQVNVNLMVPCILSWTCRKQKAAVVYKLHRRTGITVVQGDLWKAVLQETCDRKQIGTPIHIAKSKCPLSLFLASTCCRQAWKWSFN